MKPAQWTLLFAGLALSAAPLAQAAEANGKTYDFPIYKNKSSGRQLTGQHAPATTPALDPEESRKQFKVPPGFEVRLFASEPEVVNPVAMTWDERGRLWVVELYEYPLGAKPGEKPRDRVKILEDTDGDGRADKVTVFTDGLNLATAIILGNGGVYVGQAPDLLFFKDTNGDDKADERKVVMTGFGLEDRHELLNSFTWGPDGLLYLTHGVFTQSKVKNPADSGAPAVIMNAAVARFDPRTKEFEVFADGTSNPWGVDFDRYGNAFVSACVIDHFFHMAPGGIYVRQGGVPADPYSYELLPSIVDHKHFMAAYAGVDIYQGNQYPREWQGEALMGNIHQSAINHDHLTPNGSSFKAHEEKDFLTTADGWFRPVSTQTGPDGALWIMDWYDKYPCYQNANADPEGVDREYGRIWRVVYTGNEPGKKVPSRPSADMNLAKLSTGALVGMLADDNVWQRRMAKRLLNERSDPTAKPLLEKMFNESTNLDARLGALWALHGAGQLDESVIDAAARDKEPSLRAWAARLTGERRMASEAIRDRMFALARDSDPTVRYSVAVAARQFISGSLTVNTGIPIQIANVNTGPLLAALVASSADAQDPLIPFMIWQASEPRIARNPEPFLEWLQSEGVKYMPLAGQIARKAMRRICDLRRPGALDQAVQFIAAVTERNAVLAIAAIDGLLEGQKGKAIMPAIPTAPVLAKIEASPSEELRARGRQLGTLWGDAEAIQRTLKLAVDGNMPMEERLKAVQSLRQLKNDAARDALLGLVIGKQPDALLVESILGLSEIGGDNVGSALVAGWVNFSTTARRAAADTLVSRPRWANEFLGAMENKSILVGDVPASAIRSLVNSRSEQLRANAARVIGKYREPDADKLKLIAEKKKVVLAAEPDLAAGRELARKTCLVCHKFYGEGAEVGPDLTGVGRSTLDALLHNVIHPNEVIGKGYENVEVETKDGRTVSGRLVEDTDTRVRLLSAGPREEIVAKSEIASRRVSDLSVMPEGLEQMPEADFRNLIWYILNPPQDKKPLTPERRKELIGDEKPRAEIVRGDGESVALWNPAWRVNSGADDGAPAKLVEFHGRNNVLMTHPFSRDLAASLARTIELPAGWRSVLRFNVASHDRGDWELHVLVNGQTLLTKIVDHAGERWKSVEVDLGKFAGKKVEL
ncbi:MAG TPA: PVC-type heme-binding CxxCH protein, partial [Verrucomicrobiae bacterium]|nr:PVC-type heme-binding CxxCH protein [Verrucomicrobiae bacterium]